MAERLHRIDVHNPQTMGFERSLPVPCDGVNHADYSGDLSFFLASCEFSGKLLVVDRNATRLIAVINLNVPSALRVPPVSVRPCSMGGPKSGLTPGASAMPQDVRLTPDGTRFLVADMLRNGSLGHQRQDPEGRAVHPHRHGRPWHLSGPRRAGGSSSATAMRGPSRSWTPPRWPSLATWTIPGGGSPDMGGVTADGSQLWLSGATTARSTSSDTSTGALIKRIPVNAGPHGLLVWPQPGSFSLGHTGNMR
jgi:DNA-binding beta-propeller fold protein YncE